MIKELKNQGLSIRAIKRETGHSRKTISKYLNRVKPPEYKPRPRKPSKLEPYKDYIRSRLKKYPLSAIRLFEEIQGQGYMGSYSLLCQFVYSIKKTIGVKAIYRFETKPGKQAQVDWSEVAKIRVDGKTKKLYCFNMILGYSRMKYIEFTLQADTATFIQCHLNAFKYFAGYTKEILYDNTKNVVIKRAIKASDSTFNDLFEDFFMYYGFTPRLCRTYRAQTKGKVENSIKYAKGNFILGREFKSLDDANNQRWSWLDKVNSKVHGTTHVIPSERLKEENLQSIDDKQEYIVCQTFTRKVARDCFISFQANKYSVPYMYAGREAIVKTNAGRFQVLIDGKTICEHEIIAGKNRVSRKKEHFKGLLKEILKDGCTPYQKLPLMNFSGEDIDVEKRSLDVYDQIGGGS